jgi:hypothetical protein
MPSIPIGPVGPVILKPAEPVAPVIFSPVSMNVYSGEKTLLVAYAKILKDDIFYL